MHGILFGFVLGAVGFHLLNTLPELIWCAVLLPGVLVWRIQWLRPMLALMLGACWSLVHVNHQMAQWLPLGLEGQDLILQGRVEGLPAIQGQLQRFQVDVQSLRDPQGNPVPASRVQLSWFGRGTPVQAGENWRFKVRLKQPRGLHNPVGYDGEKGMLSQGIGARGYVRAGPENRRLDPPGAHGVITRLRQAIAAGLDEYTGNLRSAALFKALVVGDRRSLSRSDWQVFTRTGTNHLIAISGLHVGIVAGWSLWLGNRLWRRSEKLCQRLPSIKAGAWLSLISAVSYASLAGFSLPTQRALLMLSVVLGALILGLRISLGRALLWALFLVVLWDPLAPLQAGFWLSFLAVAAIWWSVSGRLHAGSGWRQGLRIQWAVSIGLLPVLFLLFGQASLISPIVNLIMVPWFSLVLVPLLLLGLPLMLLPQLAAHWYSGLGYFANQTFWLLDGFAEFSWASLAWPETGVWVWILMLTGVLLWLLPRGLPGRWMGIWFCLPFLATTNQRPDAGEFWLTLLDVGQGLACVVETREHVLLYDIGPGSVGGYSAAEAVVVPYLRSLGVARVDRMILSNGDQDHAGGVGALRAAFPGTSMLSGEVDRVPDSDACVSGTQWVWDGVVFRILHPAEGDRFSDSNNRSCVLQIETGEQRVLLPGDIETPAELRLVQRHADKLASQILIAPHHGSAGSSSMALVNVVKPEWVLFSVGYRNPYDFPKAEVVERWRSQGAAVLNTAESGAIRFHIKPRAPLDSPEIHCAQRGRYWQNCSGMASAKRASGHGQ
ncbi:MAG: DNA internalization-related competence protein ComEC/Rec2 [Candidatus Thiodiazotropha sp.]